MGLPRLKLHLTVYREEITRNFLQEIIDIVTIEEIPPSLIFNPFTDGWLFSNAMNVTFPILGIK